MSFEELAPVTDVSAGAWIAPRPCGFGGRACCVVPSGFAGYARVLRPPADEHGGLASWAQACGLTGRIAHPVMQWHAISAAPQAGSQAGASCWPGSDPEVGGLPPAVLVGVLEVLAGFTADPGDCYHAVRDGWGWLDGGDVMSFAYDASGPRRLRAHQRRPDQPVTSQRGCPPYDTLTESPSAIHARRGSSGWNRRCARLAWVMRSRR